MKILCAIPCKAVHGPEDNLVNLTGAGVQLIGSKEVPSEMPLTLYCAFFLDGEELLRQTILNIQIQGPQGHTIPMEPVALRPTHQKAVHTRHIPFTFKPEKTGTYTITVSVDGSGESYSWPLRVVRKLSPQDVEPG